jgi:polyphenol oxidase
MAMLKPLLADCLAARTGICHGFFTRHGGVSQGLYATLNCGLGSGDEAAAVGENRARVQSHLAASAILTAHQVHSATAVTVSTPWADGGRPRADALVTAKRGLALAVLSADCAPILFADAEASIVAAAHAGWRGAIGGIIEAAIAAMEELGARRTHIAAAVGPCIGQSAYEVGGDFRAQFLQRDPESASFFNQPRPGKRPHFDLAGYVSHRLARAGVQRIGAAGTCTYTQRKDFFSFRRSQSHREPDYGRQISAIVLT